MIMWIEHHAYNQKMGGEVWAMLHTSSDTQGRHWLPLGTNPLENGNQMTLSITWGCCSNKTTV